MAGPASGPDFRALFESAPGLYLATRIARYLGDIGTPADKHDRAFGMFERLHEGRTPATGTGLGLALRG